MSAPAVLTRTDELDRPAWLTARRAGIGGSDAAAILGLDGFKSPLGVYLDKRGELRHAARHGSEEGPDERYQAQLPGGGGVIPLFFAIESVQLGTPVSFEVGR